MTQEVINHQSGTYKKIASRQSTPSSDATPKALVVERGLTIFLGGAGMVGSYNEDMVSALKEVGIANPVYGNYSSLITGLDSYVPSIVDMLGDASAVALYNQDETDPVVFEYGELQKCRYGNEYVEKKYLFGLITVREYNKVECTPTSDLLAIKLGRDLKAIKSTDFSLANIGISKSLPSIGQFNIIGYSWGAVIAARTAIFHARQGVTVNHLVLIGAPINASLKEAVSIHPRILNTHIVDLMSHGDPIFAGMSDQQIVDSALKLANQMPTAEGHFYYSGDNPAGRARRRQLANSLYEKGLR